MSIVVRVQQEDFDVGHELQSIRHQVSNLGAVATFIGLVRDIDHGKSIQKLELEYYPGMTEKSLHRIASEALQRWKVGHITVIHRIGLLKATEQIVLVAVAAAHRHAAFQACEFVMDYLKTQAPFWKKEYTDTHHTWVESKQSDDEAMERWK